MSRFVRLIKTILGRNRMGFQRNHGMEMATDKLDARVVGAQCDVPRHPRVEALTVKGILQKKPSRLYSVKADATSLEGLKIMAEHDIGAVLVLDDGRLTGIFCERDYARSSVQAAQLASAMPMRQVMRRCNIFVDLNDSVQKCVSLMIENHLRYLPVQEAGDLIAVLSLEDSLIEMAAYLTRVFKENELDRQILFLRGAYSC